MPELFGQLHKHKNDGIIKIPNLNDNKLIPVIYDLDHVHRIEENIIFFDTVYGEEFGSNLEGYKNIINTLLSTVKDRILVKPHPREKSRIFKCKYYEGENYPFECNCAKQNMGDKVLISVFSTSCIVPKMIFDQEPVVIFLCKIVESLRVNSSTLDERFCEAFRETYRDKKRVLIPKNLDELKNILDNIVAD